MVAVLPQRIEELGRLTEGDPELAPYVDRLTAAAAVKSDELQRLVDLERAGRNSEAIARFREGEARILMAQIRADISRIEQIETDRLALRVAEYERGAVTTFWISAIAGALVLLLAAVSMVLIARHVSALKAAHDAIDEVNASLENKVDARTAQLRRANEEIQRFAYIVSHDLRAPLVNVMGYTSELEQAGKAVERMIAQQQETLPVDGEVVVAVKEDMPEAIGFIRASTEKMDRLINAILRLSREGRRALSPERLNMTEMAQRIADAVNHQVEAVGAQITVETLPSVESDRFSMEQILGNLIDNAVKYLEPGRKGLIVVSGEETEERVTYRIADNGRGISQRDHERIFELFRRAGRQDQPGEGLGLAFVRNSVRRLGGEIDVESELGKGSTFVLKFPRQLILGDAGDIS